MFTLNIVMIQLFCISKDITIEITFTFVLLAACYTYKPNTLHQKFKSYNSLKSIKKYKKKILKKKLILGSTLYLNVLIFLRNYVGRFSV